jgi:hypothetical protein
MTVSAHYRLYGLIIESEFELPAALFKSRGHLPDAQFRRGRVHLDGLTVGERLGRHLYASPDALWLDIPDVARFLVSGGNEIVVECADGADEDSVKSFLLGPALGLILLQRRLLVLHGNAIKIGDGCLICVGQSQSGKSTLAAEFMKRGYPILADDVAPVDELCHALPGVPQIKLTRDATERLNISTKGLHAIQPNIPKFALPLDDEQYSSSSVPVRWVYVLSPRPNEQLRISRLNGMDRLPALRDNTYRGELLQAMGLLPEHLQACGRLAGRAQISELTRPEHGVMIEEIADCVLTDIEINYA